MVNKIKTTEGVYRKNKPTIFLLPLAPAVTDRQTQTDRQTKIELHIYKSVGFIIAILAVPFGSTS